MDRDNKFEGPMLFFDKSNPYLENFVSKAVDDAKNKPLKVLFGESEKPRNRVEKRVLSLLKDINLEKECLQSFSKASAVFWNTKIFDHFSFILEENENFAENGFSLHVNSVPKKTFDTQFHYSQRASGQNRWPVIKGSLNFNDTFGRCERTKLTCFGSVLSFYKYRELRLKMSFPLMLENSNSRLHLQVGRESKRLSQNLISQRLPLAITFKTYEDSPKGSVSYSFVRSFSSNIINNASSTRKLLSEQDQPSVSHSLVFSRSLSSPPPDRDAVLFRFAELNYRAELKHDSLYAHLLKTHVSFKESLYLARFVRNQSALQNFLKFLCLESNSSLDHILPLPAGAPRQISYADKFNANGIRGFEFFGPSYSDLANQNHLTVGDPLGHDCLLQNSLRLSVMNYPLLKLLKIFPFVHFTTALPLSNVDLVQHRNSRKGMLTLLQNVRLSAGFGIYGTFSLGHSIELLFNFFHFSKAGDKVAQFQIRAE